MLSLVPVEFVLFGLTLIGIATLQRHTLHVAVAGLVGLVAYKFLFSAFDGGAGWLGLARHLAKEWVPLTNLFGLLTGFALLANHFYESRVPAVLPRLLPGDWKGGFVLLLIVFALSAFLDNIAAAVIGGAAARPLFRNRLHIGYIAGIVAAANAGGAGSVVGDTTTTMMWIAGVSPLAVLEAYIASTTAILFCGILAAKQQQRYSPIVQVATANVSIDWARVGIVICTLAAAIGTNVLVNGLFAEYADRFPYIGAAVWIALLSASLTYRADFALVPAAARSSAFLLALVLAASLMPVERLPEASWHSAFALGFVSAVFDNIPLTALALEQGGYDWGILAFSVGFGGSMIWFGSSAGVGLSNLFPESRSVLAWVRGGWHVIAAYLFGFVAVMVIAGWNPSSERTSRSGSAAMPLRSNPLEAGQLLREGHGGSEGGSKALEAAGIMVTVH